MIKERIYILLEAGGGLMNAKEAGLYFVALVVFAASAFAYFYESRYTDCCPLSPTLTEIMQSR